jgi:hypothetical protein
MDEKDATLMRRLEQIELWLTFFFLIDYIMYLYASDQRTKHVMAPLNVIDFVTILPGTVAASLDA